MFRWSSPNLKKTKQSRAVRQRRITLHLEALEARDCPSASALVAPVEPAAAAVSNTAPAIVAAPGISLSLSVVPGPGGTATVSGQVSGGSPTGGLTVTLSGVVSGSVATCADGTFTYTGPASGPGQIQAAATDAAGTTVTSATKRIARPPTIVNFRAIYNGNNNWTFTGQVHGPHAAGLVVTLAGIPSLDNRNASATVQASGSFSYTITLQPGECGGVTAECIDLWGHRSNEATTYVWS
jgi:hypothetical protein